MDRCFFDKWHIFHHCNDDDNDCCECPNERVIARTFISLCHWCGNEIVSDRIRGFCNKQCQKNWQSTRLSYEPDLDGGMYWTSIYGICPIYTVGELRRVQKMMLGSAHEINKIS